MSSMYLNWARQSSEEFSALETSFIAISFLAGSSRPTAATETEFRASWADVTDAPDAFTVPSARHMHATETVAAARVCHLDEIFTDVLLAGAGSHSAEWWRP